MKFELHKVLPSGALEYRIPGSTRTIRVGSKVFVKDSAPQVLEVGDENTQFAPADQATVDKEAKEKAKAEAKAAKDKAKADAKAEKDKTKEAAKAEREAAREKARAERQAAREKATADAAAAAAAAAPGTPAASM